MRELLRATKHGHAPAATLADARCGPAGVGAGATAAPPPPPMVRRSSLADSTVSTLKNHRWGSCRRQVGHAASAERAAARRRLGAPPATRKRVTDGWQPPQPPPPLLPQLAWRRWPENRIPRVCGRQTARHMPPAASEQRDMRPAASPPSETSSGRYKSSPVMGRGGGNDREGASPHVKNKGGGGTHPRPPQAPPGPPHWHVSSTTVGGVDPSQRKS